MIAIADYGIGNLRSVQKAFNKIGYEAVISGDKKMLDAASHIVLPGVGAFPDAIELLRSTGLDKAITDAAADGKPILGICLGMQLLFDKSYECGVHNGLGLIKGEITKFHVNAKIPEVGWNTVNIVKPSILFKDIDGEYFYFVHSFYAAAITEDTSGVTEYEVNYTSAVENNNVFGVQFHPEKSGDVGLKLLKNFAEIPYED